MNSSKRGTVNPVSPWLGLQIIPFVTSLFRTGPSDVTLRSITSATSPDRRGPGPGPTPGEKGLWTGITANNSEFTLVYQESLNRGKLIQIGSTALSFPTTDMASTCTGCHGIRIESPVLMCIEAHGAPGGELSDSSAFSPVVMVPSPFGRRCGRCSRGRGGGILRGWRAWAG